MFVIVILVVLSLGGMTFAEDLPRYNALFEDAADFNAEHPPAMLEVSIPSHGALLTGTYYIAAGRGPHPTIVMLHAFPGYEKNLDLAQSLRRIGFNLLYFDYRGVWGGPGQFSIERAYEDSAAAIDFVIDSANRGRLRVDTNNVILLGHSFGAVAALEVGARNPAVHCIVSLAPEDMTLMIDTPEDRQSLANYTDNLRVVTGYSGQQLIDDLVERRAEWAMTTVAKDLGDKPWLLIGAALDENYTAADVARVVAAGKQAGSSNISSRIIEYADHSFSARRTELTVEVAAWLEDECLE